MKEKSVALSRNISHLESTSEAGNNSVNTFKLEVRRVIKLKMIIGPKKPIKIKRIQKT